MDHIQDTMPSIENPIIAFQTVQKTGDIILVGESQKGSPNLAIQSLLTGEGAVYAHVLLCVLPGLYIHSTPKHGVDFLDAELPEADFPERYGPRWAVFRNPRVADDQALGHSLMERAMFYFGQMYNWRFQASPIFGPIFGTSHSFCSELVARIFNDLGLPLFGERRIRPERILPTHVARAIHEQKWSDITEDYRRMFKDSKVIKPDLLLAFSRADVTMCLAVRAIFKKTAMLGTTSAVTRVRLNIEQDKLAALLKSFRELIQDLDQESLKGWRVKINEWMKENDMNPRSIRSEYESRLTAVFAADQWISAVEPEARSFAETMYESKGFSWMEVLVGQEEMARKFAVTLYNAAVRVAECSQTILYEMSVIRNATDRLKSSPENDQLTEAREKVNNNIRAYAGRCAVMIQSLEDYDGYDEEIKSTGSVFLKHIAERPLENARVCELVGMMVKEVHCRTIMLEIRKALQVVAREPENIEAAFQSYSLAMQLVPLSEDRLPKDDR